MRKVAETIGGLTKPAGQRPVRTAVDFIGIAEYVTPYNGQFEHIMQGVYGAFGMSEMLKPRVK